MADQSVHDVVIQPQSVDALRSTDVSGSNDTDSAARAAADYTTLNGSDIEHANLPPFSEIRDTSQQSTVNIKSDVSNIQDSRVRNPAEKSDK